MQVNVNHDNVISKIEDLANRISKNQGYIDYNISITDIKTTGGSYMGKLYAVEIKGKTNSDDKQTNVFVKNMVETNIPLTYVVSEVYRRENFVYSELIDEFHKLQDEFKVPIDERFKTAKFFDEGNEQFVILENLTAKGFKTYNRMDVVSLEYAELAIKDLARFHGLSLAMKVLNPEYFNNKIAKLRCLYLLDDNWQGFIQNMKGFALKFLDADLRNKVQSKVANIIDKYPDYMRDSSCVRTVCHGDFRHNNIMVREVDGKPAEVAVVDYQITYFGNPVLDIIYFVFWATDKEFRKNHLNHLKNLYYEYLETFLKHFNVSLEEVFPKREFEEQFRQKLDFGLMISVFYLPFLFPLEDDVPDLVSGDQTLDKIIIKVDDKYRERFQGIVEDFIEWGYL